MTDYTSPSTRSNNFLVDEDVYNDELVNNIKHLHEAINSIVILEDQKAQNTDGGTFTSGAWQTRTLNTEVADVNSVCTLSSNQFTLSAGTYDIVFWAMGVACDRHQTRIQNVTDGTTIRLGVSAYSDSMDNSGDALLIATLSQGAGRFTIAASKALELQHRCETTKATNGYGVAANFTTEVYAQVWLRKVA